MEVCDQIKSVVGGFYFLFKGLFIGYGDLSLIEVYGASKKNEAFTVAVAIILSEPTVSLMLKMIFDE